MDILFRNALVVNPAGESGRMEIRVSGGRIAQMAPRLSADGAVRIIDVAGRWVTPGLVDIHVHFREPGQTHKETIATGCMAAARGGFTTVCTMPNTRPPNDRPEITESIRAEARRANGVRVLPVGAISRGLGGGDLTDFEALRGAGCVALSDDGMPVMNAALMRAALERAGSLNLLIISHSEELTLAEGGVINAGETAAQLGVKGIPNAAESIAVMREIALSELTGVPVHIAHVSTAESVEAIRMAKERGVPVTAETAPHYLTLTDRDVLTYGTHAKMNPPLRSVRDRDAVRRGLVDGTLDAIATDHAPHAPEEKAQPLAEAPNGIIGLESALPVCLGLVHSGILTSHQLIDRMAVRPARIVGLPGVLAPGEPADLTVIDPAAVHEIRAAEFLSRSRNCPFDGWSVKGRADLTMTAGRIVFDSGALSAA